jgi:hypothetical protein
LGKGFYFWIDDLLLGLLDDLRVDADLAELVLDHGDLVAVVFLEDAVQERGLARAEKAGEDRHRHHLFLCHAPSINGDSPHFSHLHLIRK